MKGVRILLSLTPKTTSNLQRTLYVNHFCGCVASQNALSQTIVACFNDELSSPWITSTLNHNVSANKHNSNHTSIKGIKEREDQAQFIIVFKQLLENCKNDTHINIACTAGSE